MDRQADSPNETSLDPEDRAALLAEAEAEGVVRHDGWTGERRIAFLEALAAGHKVLAAARHAGMTPQGARKLKARAPVFARIWDETFAFLAAEIEESAIHRAIHGSERPVMSRGRQVATRVHYHDALVLRLLAARDPLNYAPLRDRAAWLKAIAERSEPAQDMTEVETSETSPRR